MNKNKIYPENPEILSDKAKAKRLKRIKKSAGRLAAEKQKERLREEDLRTILEEEARMLIDCGCINCDIDDSPNYIPMFSFDLEGWDDMD
jgi:hypothetical protein